MTGCFFVSSTSTLYTANKALQYFVFFHRGPSFHESHHYLFLYINYLLVCLKAFILCFLSVPISFRVPFRLSFSGTFSAIVFQVQMAATETTPEAKQVEHHLEPLIGKVKLCSTIYSHLFV